MMSLQNKVCLVTGGTQGIGAGCVRKMSELGATVVFTGRNTSAGNDVETLVRDAGGSALFLPQDVSKEDQWQRIIDETLERFGQLDGLVNNAGISFLKPIEDISLEDFRQLLRVDVDSVFLGMKYAMNAMESRGGSIVNISSLMGQVGLIYGTAYCAAKGAVTHLTKCAALEAAPLNIRVNSVHPGVIWTRMVVDLMGDDEAVKEQLRTETPLQVLGKPSDIAEGVAFLLSDQSSYITGSEFTIDGGRGCD